MKQFILYIIMCLSIALNSAYGQTLPTFTQKISDGFLFDPSLAGLSGGSAVAGYKKQWANVNGSPEYIYLGAHTLFGHDKMGTGINLYLEESNFLENYFLVLPFAYHMPVTENSGISFGLAPELTRSQINWERVIVQDENDPVIQNLDDKMYYDISYGMNYHNPLFQVGVSASRVIAMLQDGNERPLNGYMTGYATLFLPVRQDKDRLEPMVIYRYPMNGPGQVDVNLFYFHSLGIIAGLSYRTGNLGGVHAGYNLNQRLIIGYGYEMIFGEYGGNMGGSHEIICRYNFNKQYYARSARYRNRPGSSITIKKKQKR